MNRIIKNVLLIFVFIVLCLGIIFLYKWYQGKNAPSERGVMNVESGEKKAYFAGGCFWCVEADLEKMNGVREVISGYMGGHIDAPSYKQVASGITGHRESVEVFYNPDIVSYRSLVLNLLSHTDPTDSGGTFYDRGHQYTTAIYYQNEEERRIAENVIEELNGLNIFDKDIVTSVEPVGVFWVAEDYHQDYYKKSGFLYNRYRKGSGRDDFIESVWGGGEYDYLFENMMDKKYFWQNYKKPSNDELKNSLTPMQYEVTQKDGTEPAFKNEYFDNHEEGIYVDILSGEPLFSSTDKFDSGTGWPSFLRPIKMSFVVEKPDFRLIVPRTEIRSVYSDSHLGHIILDGPEENNKVRYCMNSAALRFVPMNDMRSNGYEDFLYLFDGMK